MQNEKISQLPSYPAPIDADIIPVVDTTAGATKKATRSNLLTAKPIIGAALTQGSESFTTTSGMRGWDGWEDANESWTYASYDSTNATGVITVPTNAVVRYSPGMKIRFTQTTIQYGIIQAVSPTTITVYFGTQYSLANAAISANVFSLMKTPLGFLTRPDFWSQRFTYTNAGTSTSASWAQVSNHQLSIPIGAWLFRTKTGAYLNTSGANQGATGVAYSTSTNSVSDDELVQFTPLDTFISSATDNTGTQVSFDKTIIVAVATTYFELIYRYNAGTGGVDPRMSLGIAGTGVIEVVNAYL